ncbi:MAG: FprA family A-type flavoprotein [Treponema sp.]|nr:FprA family A-type flavoprotein [Treponema sp.]
MKISDTVKYVGVDDHEIDLFEGQFEVPNGMAYNSYIIFSDSIAVMDSVDARFGGKWMDNIRSVLDENGGRNPDYLVVQHMEMDHSANIKLFADTYPDAKIVASKMAFTIMKNLFGTDFPGRQIVVSDGSALELGKGASLKFFTAPNVHWPEVIMTYYENEGTLFSADAFGKFGALDYDDPEGWICEARRYYFGIVGKFGTSVQALLKKIDGLGIKKICPLHGPVLDACIEYYIGTYTIWSSYDIECDGVAIFYTSVYGNTRKAAEKLAEILKKKGCPEIALNDLAREDIYECVEDAFRYGKIVLATTTYNGGVFPKMKDFINLLTERNYQNRTVALIENGSWAPVAAKGMAAMFEGCRDIHILESRVSIKTSVTDETVAALEKLADEIYP